MRCDAEDSSLRVFSGSLLRASVSQFSLGDAAYSWHGDYELGRAAKGEPAPFTDTLPEDKMANSQPRPPGERFYGYQSEDTKVDIEIELPATATPPPTTR